MKYILAILLFASSSSFAQRITVPSYDTTTHEPLGLTDLRPTYTRTPVYSYDDSTIGSHAIDSIKMLGRTIQGRKDGSFVSQTTLPASVDSFWRTPGIDSNYFKIAGTTYAVKDSTGSGGGGGVTSGTYASMIASSPTDGQRYSVSDYLPGPWTYAAFDSNFHYMIAPTYSVYPTNGFSSTITQTGGAGSGWQNNIIDNTSRYGVSALYNVGTTATGYAAVSISAGSIYSLAGNGGLWQSAMRARERVSTLSTPTDRYWFTVGVSSANSGGVSFGNNGAMYFLYSDSLNSGKWICALGEGTSPTEVNTTVTVDNSFHEFVIMYKLSHANTKYSNGGTGSSLTAYYYIDKTLVATIPYTGSISTGTYNAFTGTAMHKTVGTTNVSFYLSEFSTWNYGQDR